MSRRIVIITEIIAPYRIPVFNALRQCRGVDLQVIFLAEHDPTEREWLIYKDEIRFPYEVLPSWRRRVGRHNFLLNWGAERALRPTPPDVARCGGYNNAASWQSMSWARRNRVPFGLWVETKNRDSRAGHRLIQALKTRFLPGCDAFQI